MPHSASRLGTAVRRSCQRRDRPTCAPAPWGDPQHQTRWGSLVRGAHMAARTGPASRVSGGLSARSHTGRRRAVGPACRPQRVSGRTTSPLGPRREQQPPHPRPTNVERRERTPCGGAPAQPKISLCFRPCLEFKIFNFSMRKALAVLVQECRGLAAPGSKVTCLGLEKLPSVNSMALHFEYSS